MGSWILWLPWGGWGGLKNLEGGIFANFHENRKISLYKNRNARNFSDHFMYACTLGDLNLFILTIKGSIFESGHENIRGSGLTYEEIS